MRGCIPSDLFREPLSVHLADALKAGFPGEKVQKQGTPSTPVPESSKIETKVEEVPEMRGKLELCESAKKGHVCIDDLCRGNPDDTLCGFDQSLWEELTAEMDDSDPDDWDQEIPA